VTFIEDATAAVFPPNSIDNTEGTVGAMNLRMKEVDVIFKKSNQLIKIKKRDRGDEI